MKLNNLNNSSRLNYADCFSGRCTQLFFIIIAYCFSIPVQAGTQTQKDALAEYQSDSSEYSKVLSYYDAASKSFDVSIYDDEAAIEKVNDLFLSMAYYEDSPVNVTPDLRKKFDDSLADIEKNYPDSERKKLYEALECNATGLGFSLYEIKCGLGNFGNLSGGTLFELTTNTLLLAPLTVADFVSAGSGTAVKATTKTSKLLSIEKIAGKTGLNLAKTVGDKITKIKSALASTKALKAVKITNTYYKLEKFHTSTLFKAILNLSSYATSVVSNMSEQGLTEEQLSELEQRYSQLDQFSKNCEVEFSATICETFVNTTKSDLQKVIGASADTGGQFFHSAAEALDNKLVAWAYDMFRIGVIDNFSSDNVDWVKTLTDVGAKTAEFLPYVGPTAAYVNSNLKAKEELTNAVGQQIAQYLSWNAEKRRLQQSVLTKYQLLVIARSINLIERDNHFVFQELNPNRFIGQTISPLAVIEASNFQIKNHETVDKIIQYSEMIKGNCTIQDKDYVLTTNTFDLDLPLKVTISASCNTVTYEKLTNYHGEVYSGTPFKITFELNNNLIRYSIPKEKIYSDVSDDQLNKYLLTLTRLSVLYGEKGKFYPEGTTTKAEFYAMVARLFYPKGDYGSEDDFGLRYKTFLEAQLDESFLSSSYTDAITYDEAAELVYKVRKNTGLEPDPEPTVTECQTKLGWSAPTYQLYDKGILTVPKSYYQPVKVDIDMPKITFDLCFDTPTKKQGKSAFKFPASVSMKRKQVARLLYRARYGEEG